MHKFIPPPCGLVFVFSEGVMCSVVESVVIHELVAVENGRVESMPDVGVVSSTDDSTENKTHSRIHPSAKWTVITLNDGTVDKVKSKSCI